MGESKEEAATFAYHSTAFPMLTGTLVTVAGFVPIGLNNSSAGEYTFTLFAVIAVAMLVSWVVAVLFAPVLGVHILSAKVKPKPEKPGRLAHAFDTGLLWCMRHRWLTIGATVLMFVLSVFGLGLVQNQFFPSSDRPEILVDLNLPQNASIAETLKVTQRFEETLKGDPDIVRWSSYIGEGAIRFYLPLDQQLQNPFFAQLVIVSTGLESRDALMARLEKRLRDDFVGVGTFVHTLELGPPVGQPLQYRVSGPNIDQVRKHAIDLATVLDANTNVGEINFNWNEPGKVLRIDIAQDKARQYGLSSEDVARVMNSIVSGAAVSQVKDDIYLINIVGRAVGTERDSPETLLNLQITTPSGTSIPLLAFASVRYELEQPLIWSRDRIPTLTLKASVRGSMQPTDLVADLKPAIDKFAADLPRGYTLQTGGTVEQSAKAQGPIAHVVPLMLFLKATFLMIQLQSVQKMFLVASVAPLGLIGVVLALVPTGTPMGFVAILGVLALVGIIIRNSVILVTQIDQFERDGYDPWHAVVQATEHRRRPILLTAAAASLGMIPIAREVFWGPMAYAMIGGIISATLLTLLFLPALYVAWYKIKESKEPSPVAK
jgi:multidrug efflux pump subunit AcrB